MNLNLTGNTNREPLMSYTLHHALRGQDRYTIQTYTAQCRSQIVRRNCPPKHPPPCPRFIQSVSHPNFMFPTKTLRSAGNSCLRMAVRGTGSSEPGIYHFYTAFSVCRNVGEYRTHARTRTHNTRTTHTHTHTHAPRHTPAHTQTHKRTERKRKKKERKKDKKKKTRRERERERIY